MFSLRPYLHLKEFLVKYPKIASVNDLNCKHRIMKLLFWDQRTIFYSWCGISSFCFLFYIITSLSNPSFSSDLHKFLCINKFMILFNTIKKFFYSFIHFLLRQCLGNRKGRNKQKCQIEDLCDTSKVDSELIFISFIRVLLLILGKCYIPILLHHYLDM